MREAMQGLIQSGRPHSIARCAVACVFGWCGAARAEDASSWKDIETKYVFGFTTGSGIGLEGEKEFTADSIGRFGKRDGHYAATETKYEFEFAPTQFIQIEFGALGSTPHIGGVRSAIPSRSIWRSFSAIAPDLNSPSNLIFLNAERADRLCIS
jgi:hypothetical protein